MLVHSAVVRLRRSLLAAAPVSLLIRRSDSAMSAACCMLWLARGDAMLLPQPFYEAGTEEETGTQLDGSHNRWQLNFSFE